MKNSNYLKWLIASNINKFGDIFTSIAIPIYIYNITNNATLVGVVVFCDYFPRLILSPIIGIKFKSAKSKNLLRATSILSLLVVLMFGIVNLNIFALIFLNTSLSILSLIFNNTSKVMLPKLVDEEHFYKANSIITTSLQTITFFAGIIGAYISIKYSIKVLFVIDSITFLIFNIIFLTIDYDEIKYSEDILNLPLIHEIKQGYQLLLKDYKIFYNMTKPYFCILFIRGLYFSQLIIFITVYLGYSKDKFSIAMALLIIGSFIGQLIIILCNFKNEKRIIKNAFISYVIFFVLLLIIKNIYIFIIISLFELLVVNSWFVYFYKTIEDKDRFPIISFLEPLFTLSQILGILLFITISYFDLLNILYIIGIIPPLIIAIKSISR